MALMSMIKGSSGSSFSELAFTMSALAYTNIYISYFKSNNGGLFPFKKVCCVSMGGMASVSYRTVIGGVSSGWISMTEGTEYNVEGADSVEFNGNNNVSGGHDAVVKFIF